MEYNWNVIGERIRKERKKKGYTQADICDYLVKGRNTVSDWENGRCSTLSVDELVKLCRLFDCEIGYLLCEYDTPYRVQSDIATEMQLSIKAVENITRMKDKHKKLFGNGRNNLDILLSNDDFFALLTRIADYKNDKEKGIDRDTIDAKAFSLCRDFMNIVDAM